MANTDPYSPNYDPYATGETALFVPTPYGGQGRFPNYPTDYSSYQGDLGGLSDLVSQYGMDTTPQINQSTPLPSTGVITENTTQTQPTTTGTQSLAQAAMGGSTADQLTTMLEGMGLNIGKDLVSNAISQLMGTGTLDLSNLMSAIPGYTAISNIGTATPTSLGTGLLGGILGNAGTIASMLSPNNPVLPSIAGTLGGTLAQYLTNSGLFSGLTGDVLGELTNAAGGAANTFGLPGLSLLTNPGAGMSDFSNPYSNYLSAIPMVGQVLGGLLEGILGGSPTFGPGEEWAPQMQGRTDKVTDWGVNTIKQLQTLATQEPYASMLANAQYTSGGWAVPTGWIPPTPESYTKYASGLDPGSYGAWEQGPTGTIEDWATPYIYGMQNNGLWYGGGENSLVGQLDQYKQGINLFSLLGMASNIQPAIQAAANTAQNPYTNVSTWSELGGQPTETFSSGNFNRAPTAVASPEMIKILQSAGLGDIANMVLASQQEWSAKNYGLPTDWNASNAYQYLPQYFYATGQSNPLVQAPFNTLTGPTGLLNDPTYLNALKALSAPTQEQIQAAYYQANGAPAIPW